MDVPKRLNWAVQRDENGRTRWPIGTAHFKPASASSWFYKILFAYNYGFLVNIGAQKVQFKSVFMNNLIGKLIQNQTFLNPF